MKWYRVISRSGYELVSRSVNELTSRSVNALTSRPTYGLIMRLCIPRERRYGHNYGERSNGRTTTLYQVSLPSLYDCYRGSWRSSRRLKGGSSSLSGGVHYFGRPFFVFGDVCVPHAVQRATRRSASKH